MKFLGIGTFGVELRRNLYPKVCSPNPWFRSLMTWWCLFDEMDDVAVSLRRNRAGRLDCGNTKPRCPCTVHQVLQSAELSPIRFACSAKVLWNFQQILILKKLQNTKRYIRIALCTSRATRVSQQTQICEVRGVKVRQICE